MDKVTRRKWQKNKLATDPTYRENQKDAQKKWVKGNPDYWRKYRAAHPEYTKKNRESQKGRDNKRKMLSNLPDFVNSEIAKMDMPKSKKKHYSRVLQTHSTPSKQICKDGRVYC
ncbi:MAG: hypothetical protein HOE30_09675 [Deltaproteobacteria bacterium]|nr:hypothetical protein [Deltaproteobacteria bacterium]MBT4267927.1 hypothetical protein [Deltaproteobacteria bacterium]MBT4644534.1 hypothetical protein [Deltaproteobacteria bacterium]MBT6501455.1 hypothetical protein [Deltaproteobacteria bacterium]MBT6611475.1 hypothetical protein [Deltaproteobacteria bacterium]